MATVVLTLLLLLATVTCVRGQPTVIKCIPDGALRGSRSQLRDNRSYVDAFLNIPYARPPVVGLMERALLIVLALCVLIMACGRGVICQPVVTTHQGALRGTRTAIGDDIYVDIFRNIPYARPPTGDRRFRRPEAPEPWTGIRDATAFGNQCPQSEWPAINQLATTFQDSEDCLYLNVYTPKMTTGVTSLPVMVWIHGGGLYLGTGNTYDGTELASRGVVIVTFNYRLDSLGFLSTEDGASSGNYGLWDMIRALEWVRDSISSFNGDPNDVTIFGESAGSTSVSLLVDSEAARGLFHKAIMESGVSLAYFAIGHPLLDPKPKAQALKLATLVGCETGDSSRMMDCLRTKDVQTIQNASTQIRNDNLGQPTFHPVVETTFGQHGVLSAVPLTILQTGQFSNVTTIRGFNKDEAGLGLPGAGNNGYTLQEFQTLASNFVRQYFYQSSFTVNLNGILAGIMETYVYKPNITDPIQLQAAFMEMAMDYGVAAPTIHEVQLATKFPVPPQYLYRFSYRPSNSPYPLWAGVVHTDELPFVFGDPVSNINIFANRSWTDEDRLMSQEVMTMWTNFAKHGNPTPDPVEDLVTGTREREMIGECAVLCWLLSLAYVSGQAEIVKGIPDGLLRGTRTRAGEDSYVDAFLRIPYARPPVGDLRFRRPVAPERWSGVRDATNMAPKCPQPEIPIIPRVFPESEDCLYLNVFTPERPDDGWLLPVMVWIHGGGFYQGTGSNYDGTQLAAQGVVVVTINYRLGALGFLSTEDGASPGNYGLWDMIRALEWVRDSISALNGDPDNVTIFGQSAGSASVSLLLLTEAAKGLFHKAVMQSGVSLSPWSVGYPGFVPDPRGQSLKLAERLGCPTADNNGSRRMLQCLRNVDVNMLLNASMAVTFETRGTEAVFLPVPETSFGMNSGMFGGTPEVLFKSGFFFNVTTLRGFNKDEADPDDEGFTPDRFVKEVQLFVQEYFTQTSFTVDTDAIASLLIDAYVIKPNITDHQQLRDTFIQ
ncbi:hypothetical protein BaRGS_00026507, partial [Batillaria attramentaria]